MGFIISIHGIITPSVSIISGEYLLEIENQRQKKEDGNRGDKMKDGDKTEWIEKIVECPDCKKGRTEHWKERKSGKPPWRYHFPCQTCNGDYQTTIWQPKFCAMENCNNPAAQYCGGVMCVGNGWVCVDHWREENIGYSIAGYVCITCWHEVGSGGH